MFSTGIAWSLVGVERLAAALTADDSRRDGLLDEYDRLVRTEGDHIAGLVAPAYRLRRDFAAFSAWTYVYFAAASYHEAWQRLCDPPREGGWRGVGFLGACDPQVRAACREATELEFEPPSSPAFAGPGSGVAGNGRGAELERHVGRAIATSNIAGLANPRRARMYPVDVDVLVGCAGMLGLSREELISRLPRLRGPA